MSEDTPPSLEEAVALASDGRLLEAVKLLDTLEIAGGNSPELYFNKGLVLQNLNRFQEAIHYYGRAIAAEPTYVDAFVNRGNVKGAMGDSSGAIEDYRSALGAEPQSLLATINLGVTLQNTGNGNEAILVFERAVDTWKDNTDLLFRLAMALHRRGSLESAKARFEQVLCLAPTHIPAHIGLSSVLLQTRQNISATQIASTAVRLAPNHGPGWRILGFCQLSLGKTDLAFASFSKAIELDGSDVVAIYQNAEILFYKNELSAASEAIDKLLALMPNHQDALRLKSSIFLRHGLAEPAIAVCNQLLAISSRDTLSLVNKAIALRSQGRFDDAVECYESALSFDPNSLTAIVGYGELLNEIGDRSSALMQFERAISLSPSFAEAHFGIGLVYEASGRLDEATVAYQKSIDSKENIPALINLATLMSRKNVPSTALQLIDRAIQLDPDRPEIYLARGIALFLDSKFESALDAYEYAIRLRQNFAEAWMNKGVALQKLGQLASAKASYLQSTKLRPDWDEPYYNLGVLHHEQKNYQDAIEAYRYSLARNNHHAEAHMNLGMALLTTEKLAEGWAHFEWRVRTPPFLRNPIRHPDIPRWMGQDVHERKVLLLTEQGFGDTIQFCRYAVSLARRGAKVTLVAQPRLVRLLGALPGVTVVSEIDVENSQKFDFYALTMSLPAYFDDHCPDEYFDIFSRIYQIADLESKWTTLFPRKGVAIGICWTAGSVSTVKGRDVPFELVSQLFGFGADFVSLQKELSPAEAAISRGIINFHHFGQQQNDFADAAALISRVDLVISVDTAVAHLAGAMGKETWVLLPYRADWRWFEGRVKSPWYPAMSLFRQDKEGDWLTVIERVRLALIGRLSVN